MTNSDNIADFEPFVKSIEYWNRLNNATDHEIVVIGIAKLDDSLARLLSLRLAKYESIIKSNTNFNKPLGTFSAKIDMALLTGSITKGIHGELHRVRTIRNSVAHDTEIADLSSGKLKDQCNALRTPKLFTTTAREKLFVSPRRRFQLTVSSLETTILRSSLKIKRILTPMPDIELMDEKARDSYYANVENGKLILDGKIYDINNKCNFY